MLCHKCHTSTDATDSICKNCGASLHKSGRNWSKFARISIITLVIAAFGVYVLLYNLNMIDFGFIGDIFGGSEAHAEETVPQESSETPPSSYDEAPGDEAPVLPARRSEEEQLSVLGSILSSVDSYLATFQSVHPIISNMGYLYNAAAERFVTIESLVNQGFIDAVYADEDIFILYLRPMDFEGIEEISLPSGLNTLDSEAMSVFLAYERPTGIGLYSRFGHEIIFRENLNAIFEFYNPEIEGLGVFRPPDGSGVGAQLFAAAIRAVLEHEGLDPLGSRDYIDIRYLAADGMHAFAAVSFEGQSHIIHNYVLRLRDEEWGENWGYDVIAINVEMLIQPIVSINTLAPNFNLDLFPDYDISAVHLVPESILINDGILEPFIEMGLLQEEEMPHFISGTNAFAYIIINTFERFIAYHDGGWNIMPVDDWRHAEQVLSEMTVNPPLYIIRQE